MCDFGGAKNRSQTETKSLTSFVGTPEYLAPELINSQVGKFSEDSDIWALGIIFHKMLSNNEHPFILKKEESSNRDINLGKIAENIEKNRITISAKITNPLFIKILTSNIIIKL